MKLVLPAVMLAMGVLCGAAERRQIVPARSAKPVGPYSPGILAGDYLYVSGQGARDAEGNMPPSYEGQVRQCLENIKAITGIAPSTLGKMLGEQ